MKHNADRDKIKANTMQTVRTKFHKILPLIEANEVYLTAPEKGRSSHWDNYDGDKGIFKDFVKAAEAAPKFIIDDELLDLISQEEFEFSLKDMIRADVLHLPFKEMIIEYKNCICFLLEGDTYSPGKPFGCILMRVLKDAEGEYLVIAPSVLDMNVVVKNDMIMLDFAATQANGLKHHKDLCQLTCNKDMAEAWYGVACALLLLTTHGVAKETIDVGKLNKKRVASGKPAIPTHTYIHIGRVYKSGSSEQSEEYIARKSPRPHWRRGHCRAIRFGKGRTESKLHFIPGKLVATIDTNDVAMNEYVVKK